MFLKLAQRGKKLLSSNIGTNVIQRYPLICGYSRAQYHSPSYAQYLMAASTALTLSLSVSYAQYKKEVKACGIMGMISSSEEVVDYLLEGLTVLQNRGYDSAGIATIGNNKLLCTKYASRNSTSDCLEMLSSECVTRHKLDHCGIAHTRWATHGAKSDANAHPHCDYLERIALVHNGTISNCTELKNELCALGYMFKSATDTEVIANLIGYYLDAGHDVATSFELALNRLCGSWGIAMVSNDDPDVIYAARNGSPLMIGLDAENNRNFIASEHTAFAKYTRSYISLNEGEIAVITANEVNIEDASSRIKTLTGCDIEYATSPEPYDFWTEKEIMEQPQAISSALQFGSRLSGYGNSDVEHVVLGGLTSNSSMLQSVKNLIITGCGTSLNAGLYAKRLMEYLNSFDTVQVIDSGEVINDSFPRGSTLNGTGILAISQSGETKDVMEALKIADTFGIPRFSVVNSVGSEIARETGCGTYCYAGRENAVASTKAFTSQVTVLSLIAAWFTQLHETNNKNRLKKLIQSLHKLHTYVGAIIHNAKDKCRDIANDIVQLNAKHIFVLGKGFSESIAYEGALKIKEITYIHAEGYSGGALKHGPFALIDKDVPVIMIILDDEHSKVMVTNAHEIEARHGKMIYITDNKQLLNGLTQQERIIEIPNNGPLTALLAVIPLQLIAYYIAMAKGINPDKPRNLAKSVTVV